MTPPPIAAAKASGTTRIAMLYIAEAYQCYHGHSVAIALSQRAGVDVSVFYNDPTTPDLLARIEAAFGARPLPSQRLKRGFLGSLIQLPRLLGMAKNQVMARNLRELLSYDAIISMERTASYIHRATAGDHPPLIYINHGAGDRSAAWHPWTADFDLVLPSGEKTLRRFRELGLVRPGGGALTGYIKAETTAKLAEADPDLFPERRPIVLYNPHKEPKQSSWAKAIEPMLAQFGGQDEFNLVVAPHVKKFRRRSQRLRDRWEARSNDVIRIDTGSDRSMNNSYCEMADIYVGDVSSQVYEFTTRPRPCVFLNMQGVDWRGHPEYLFWEMGEVIDRPADILPAVRRARELHPRYVDRQRELTQAALGDTTAGASERAADTILEFLAKGRVPDNFPLATPA